MAFETVGAHSSLMSVRLDVLMHAEPEVIHKERPAWDRWSYLFNATPGSRPVASTFRSSSESGLVRHALYVLGFDTAEFAANASDDAEHEIVSAKLTVYTSSNFEVVYDPTSDSVFSFLPDDHPEHVPDTDPGRPVEMFGTGFRNDTTSVTWTPTDPYRPSGGLPTVYPVLWNQDGDEMDVTAHVDFNDPVEAPPFAVGNLADVAPGDPVPFHSPMVFDVQVSDPGVQRYLQAGLASGRLFFTISSLHSGGLGVRSFPEFHTSNSLIGDPPQLELTIRPRQKDQSIHLTSVRSEIEGIRVAFSPPDTDNYGVRWSTDLKTWYLIRDPDWIQNADGILEWLDNTLNSSSADGRFYQIYRRH
jgi:hypothetical protein